VPSRWHGRAARAPLAVLLATVLLSSCGFQEPPLEPITREVLQRVEIPPISGRTAVMDSMVVDPATHLLYVSDATDPAHEGVDVFDTSTVPGRYLRIISTGATLPNGLVIAPDVHRLYTGNDDGTVSVIDIDPTSKTDQTIVATLPMGGKGAADLVTYDQPDHRVFIANPDDGFLTAVDSRTDTVVGQITNLGLLDQPMYDPADGMLYVGAVDDNLLIRIDPHSDRVVQRTAFEVSCEPHGLAVNPHTNQGIVACADKDDPVTISWDFGAMRPIRYFDLAGASDLAMYDAAYDHFIVAASSYAPAEMAVFSGGPIAYLTSVPTSHKSHDVAYDDVHRMLFTYDGRLREAGLWEFPDPVTRCNASLTHCSSEPNVPPPLLNGAPPGGR
jgi:DNA-binding beta-propeller fold protein YncE